MQQKQECLYSLKEILGDPKSGIPPIIKMSPSTWHDRVKKGVFPKPIKIGPKMSRWRKSVIDALIEKIAQEGAQ